ncbi:MAG: SDR family oxidoreductase [Porticoccaceae bacterium]|nr:SDR family oxidoreductase [Pseudomonadales bacterium]MCP5172362.1 SDR family oxidoreductase [Pseudomonadales bacterium]
MRKTMSGFDLSNRKILITGAAQGLGAEMASVLAAMGAELAITDIDEAGLQTTVDKIEQQGGIRPLTFRHDVSSAADWKQLYEQLEPRWQLLHGLVNNAGIMLHRPFTETTLEMFQKTQSINVDSVFIGSQTFLPMLKNAGEQGSASSIVNVSSIFGQVAGPLHSAYCASKGAVRLLTKSIATELPRLGYNVRCNSIHPGIMDTGVSLTGLQTMVDMGTFADVEEAANYFSAVIPMGRPGSAPEIANGVAYLLSDASSLMTGAELTLDGGYTAV